MLRFAHALNGLLLGALERAFPEATASARVAGRPLDPQLTLASKPEFGDFQANGALALARPLKQAPRQIATAIGAQLEADPAFAALCLPPEIAGPGFINLTLRPEVLAEEVRRRLADPRLGVPAVAACGPAPGGSTPCCSGADEVASASIRSRSGHPAVDHPRSRTPTLFR